MESASVNSTSIFRKRKQERKMHSSAVEYLTSMYETLGSILTMANSVCMCVCVDLLLA